MCGLRRINWGNPKTLAPMSVYGDLDRGVRALQERWIRRREVPEDVMEVAKNWTARRECVSKVQLAR